MPPDEPSLADVQRRLDRERKARREAEAIAESSTSKLYETVQELQWFKAVLEETTDFVVIADAAGRAQFLNRALCEALGVDAAAPPALDLADLLTPESRERFVTEALPAVADKGVWRGELVMVLPTTGVEAPVSQVLIGHRRSDGVLEAISGISRDITERVALEQQLTRLALHDPLTGLPNRRLFFDRLDVALARKERSSAPVGVFFVDVDDFKAVNDGYGHEAGDTVITTVAARLSSCLRPSDTVARLGGDEFAVLCEGVTDEDTARAVADRMAAAASRPIRIGDAELAVTLSMGMVVASAGAGEPSALLSMADEAMYQAKRQGKGRACLFGAQRP